jgi:hypothetical protein
MRSWSLQQTHTKTPEFRTTAPSVYAIGDVINRMQLTPVALSEGHCLSDTLFGGKPRKTDYTDIPTAVFSHPNIGTVGLTEEQARKEYGEVHIYRSCNSSPPLFPPPFALLPHTISCSRAMFCPLMVCKWARTFPHLVDSFGPHSSCLRMPSLVHCPFDPLYAPDMV